MSESKLAAQSSDWKPTSCILCECNCGIEVQLGGDDGRRFQRIRGNRKNPASRGYVCQKAGRLDHYQNSRDRLMSPLRRRPDGTFEEIDWDTAIREVAEKLAAVRDEHGGESIFYFGGGGQGNHLPGAYATSTRALLGSVYRSNALAQEKTGEFWVNHQMVGRFVRGDFEHCEVGIFLGKNPWQSHSIPRARVTVREIAKNPDRCLIVVDPRRTESADLADIHLQVKPGTDAWLVAGLLKVLLEENLFDDEFIARHTVGFDDVRPALDAVLVADACRVSGIDEDLLRRTARRIAAAESVAVFEDLGVQMNRHSTLVSYLQRLLWMLTGNFGKLGAQNAPTALVPIAAESSRSPKTTPVAGARVIAGLTPCNLIAEEILTDHPKRYRAMLVESANPAHSLADSASMRKALEALDCLVVIDVALTETARLADYVLPATTQYEKAEAVFFNFDFPENYFYLRRPLLDPPETDQAGPLPEAEIHARLAEALGALPEAVLAPMRAALEKGGRLGLGAALQQAGARDPRLARVAPALLYRVLGPTLPEGTAEGAVLWAAAHRCAGIFPDALSRAGLEGEGPMLGEALFQRILDSPDGMVLSVDPPEASWDRVRTPDGKLHLAIAELIEELESLHDEPSLVSDDFPMVLSAGERRSYTANTICRDPDWRKKDVDGRLCISPDDAGRLDVNEGDVVRLVTCTGSAEVSIEINDRMQAGHISLPNGLGLDYPDSEGHRTRRGVAPNELTAAGHRDPFAGTPWHKSVPARVERVA
ncbi:MAG: molybdopterin-dependent oxidoreductase [Thermoanaerobaculia bacterium]|nr:molybdopterin-dependent oxidoreductase [Thermoanaerobaculia bacterium]